VIIKNNAHPYIMIKFMERSVFYGTSGLYSKRGVGNARLKQESCICLN